MTNSFLHLRDLCAIVDKVDQGKLLIDAELYYSTVADLFEKARKRIYIIGWDIDSRLLLRRDSPDRKNSFFEILRRACQQNPELEIYILCWNFSMVFSFEREIWPWLKPSGWGERVHFVYDSYHPFLSCHHEKAVMIDEKLAFVGGIDFCEFRWDNSDHTLSNSRRITSGGAAYGPFHDMELMFEGPLVGRLCEHFAERWRLAAKQEVPLLGKPAQNQLWPENLIPDFRDATWAVARTVPQYKKIQRRRENYRLTLEVLRRAQKYVYIENQYLTSRAVLKVLRRLLTEPEGPEIICVLPKHAYGLVDSKSMGLMQWHALQWLRSKNPYDRLRIVHPQVEVAEKWSIYVHAKLVIVDGEVFKLGSTNLNNRSMSHDRELDLCFVAEKEADTAVIQKWHRQLLAEHLGLSFEQVQERLYHNPSLCALIDACSGQSRSLQRLHRRGDFFRHFVPWEPFFDPYRNPRFYHFRKWFSGLVRRAVKRAFNFVLNQK